MKRDDSSSIKPFLGVVRTKEAGTRLDIWLTGRLEISRKKVKQLIDDGFIKVNGKKVIIANWKLGIGDEIRVAPSKLPRIKPIYEDDHILIIDKQPGLLSVPVKGSAKPSALDAVKAYLGRKFKDSTGSFARPLHRLDAGTSGLLMFAKSKRGLKAIELFRNRNISRMYLAVVKGAIGGDSGNIDIPLKKGRYGDGRRTKAGSGKKAFTQFRIKERYKDATLVEIMVQTGRTHQIRAHLAEIGHPLLGDEIYGKPGGFNRPALHAERLIFKHPVGGQKMDVKCELPKDMDKLITKFRGIKSKNH